MSRKVSILIPIYKAECYIEKCICSVLEQTYDNIEYVIVNDASPDKSMDIVNKICRRYPQRESSIIIIENENNLGISRTRNILLNNASGDYIYFVDSDDFIAPDAISILVNNAEKFNADIVRCNYFKYYNSSCVPINRPPSKENENKLELCLLNDYGMESLWLLFIRRSLFIKHQLCFPKDINGCEDFLMTVKLFYYTKRIIDIPDVLYYYRLDNENSITHQERLFRNYSIQAIIKIKEFLQEKNLIDRYRKEVLHLMFTCKQNLLLNKTIRDIEKYVNTFPESNGYYRHYKYNFKQRLLFYLAEHKHVLLLKIICHFA